MSKFITVMKDGYIGSDNRWSSITPKRYTLNTSTIREAWVHDETSATVIRLAGQGSFSGPVWSIAEAFDDLNSALESTELP